MAEKKGDKSKKKQPNAALKYSGMAMQMAIMIGLGIFLGSKLDAYFETAQPYFTLVLSVLFLAAVMYIIIKDVSKG